jgi:sodium/hydrogen antiporter
VEEDLLVPIIVVLGASVFGYAAFARRIGRWHLTAPILFTAAGWLIWQGQSSDIIELTWLLNLAEITLAFVLFSDAAGVRPREIGADQRFTTRLLFVGLPLTVVSGMVAALLLFPGLSWPFALLLGAMLAPTDAALGAATVTDRRLPLRIRRLLNVESGLNDGLATPVVLFAIAVISGQEGLSPQLSAGRAMTDIAIGMVIGGVVGWVGGTILRWAHANRWTTIRSAGVAVLMLPAMAFFGAELLGGIGFLAAFIAGTSFATTAPRRLEHRELELTEGLTEPLGYATWMAFGALIVPGFLADIGWKQVLYAALALTVLRMIPVAVSLLGTGLRPRTLLFVGWFGPRGLATVVFLLIAAEELTLDAALNDVLATATLTVLLSVVLHGISAAPGAVLYSEWIARTTASVESAGTSHPHVRGAIAHAKSSSDDHPRAE